MNLRRYIPDHAVTTIPVLALMFAVHYFLLRDDDADSGIELVDGVPVYHDYWRLSENEAEFDIEGELQRLELDDSRRDSLIRELLQQEKYQQARTQLLEVAAAAVAEDDQTRLGGTTAQRYTCRKRSTWRCRVTM
jgi:hypothetical protein